MKADERIAAINKRLKTIPKEIVLTQGKIEESKKRLEIIEARVGEAKEERQRLLAKNKNVEKISKEISQVREEKELMEDQVVGLNDLVKELESEIQNLDAEKISLLEEAAREKLTPMVKMYNDVANQLAQITKEIYLTMLEYRQPLSEWRTSIINISSFEGFETVPRIALFSDSSGRLGNFFNMKEISSKIQGELARREEEIRIGESEIQGKDLMMEVIELLRREGIPETESLPGPKA